MGSGNGNSGKNRNGKTTKSAHYGPRDARGRFLSGCKPGPGTPKGTLRGMRALLERLDEDILAAVERGDVEAARKMFYRAGKGKGLMAMLLAYKQLGILDALLKEAAVPETVKVEIVIGPDRETGPPPGCDPYPERS